MNGVAAMVIKQLFAPLAYLRIKHSSKALFDWVIPLGIAGVATAVWFAAPVSVPLRGDDGIIFAITEFVKFLAGFYITALAAIATFDRPGMDELMDGDAPQLGGEALSRRRFLSWLFGYLAFLSIVLYVIGVGAAMLAPSARTILTGLSFEIVRGSFAFIYCVLTSSLITTTLLGLYFLTDRIVRDNPRVVRTGNPTPPQPLEPRIVAKKR